MDVIRRRTAWILVAVCAVAGFWLAWRAGADAEAERFRAIRPTPTIESELPHPGEVGAEAASQAHKRRGASFPAAEIHVRVADRDDGMPIENARVRLIGGSTLR